MKVPEAKIFVRALVEHQVPLTPCLVGAMGIGKSQIVAQVAEELGIPMVDLRLSQMEIGDLVGIPYLKDGSTHHAPPSWWPDGVKSPRGILLLDEINRAQTDVRQGAFQLILPDARGIRRLYTHVLPRGWAVVTAMNPDNGEYQVETLDKAFARRFIMLGIQADVESWLLWAKEHVNGKPRVVPEITAFIAANKELLNISENFEIDAKYSSDAWTMLSKLRESNLIPYEVEFEIMAGIVGRVASTSFRKWMDANYQRPVNGEEVLNKYDDICERLEKQRNDEWYATKLDLLTHLVHNKTLTKKQTENLKRFIKDAPADIQAAFVQGLPSEFLGIVTKDTEILAKVSKTLDKASGGK